MFRGLLQPGHLLLLLLVYLVLFGAQKLPEAGTALARAIRGFKDEINKIDTDEDAVLKKEKDG